MLIGELLSSRSHRLHAAPLFGASLMLALTSGGSPLAAPSRISLSSVNSWGYQLQQVDPDLVAASPYDLMVIDYSRDGSDEQAFTRAGSLRKCARRSATPAARHCSNNDFSAL